MADKDYPERPVIDFGRGSREQTQGGTGPNPTVYEIETARQAPPKRTQAS